MVFLNTTLTITVTVKQINTIIVESNDNHRMPPIRISTPCLKKISRFALTYQPLNRINSSLVSPKGSYLSNFICRHRGRNIIVTFRHIVFHVTICSDISTAKKLIENVACKPLTLMTVIILRIARIMMKHIVGIFIRSMLLTFISRRCPCCIIIFVNQIL